MEDCTSVMKRESIGELERRKSSGASSAERDSLMNGLFLFLTFHLIMDQVVHGNVHPAAKSISSSQDAIPSDL